MRSAKKPPRSHLSKLKPPLFAAPSQAWLPSRRCRSRARSRRRRRMCCRICSTSSVRPSPNLNPNPNPNPNPNSNQARPSRLRSSRTTRSTTCARRPSNIARACHALTGFVLCLQAMTYHFPDAYAGQNVSNGAQTTHPQPRCSRLSLATDRPRSATRSTT